jgi:hypothetical protein
MKKLLKLSFILTLAIFTFSCSNDNTDVIPEDPQNTNEVNETIKTNLTSYARNAVSTGQAETVFENNNENGGDIDDCFTINFPYSITDGNTVVVINNEGELAAYMQNNPAGGGMPVFPLTVTTADGTVVTVADELGLIQLIEDCYGDIIVIGGSDDCFTFNFPLGVLTDDGSVVTVNDPFELFTVENAVGFDFPISVTTADGNVVTINDDAGFDTLYNDCYDIDPCNDCGTNCFEIVYPLNLIDDSGNVTTINSDDEFITFLDGLPNDAFFVPTYPMTIEYEDGTQATINSDDELTAAFDACN